MSELDVAFAGIRLRNPLVASAGPIAANLDNVRRLADAGIGAIITKTGFIRKEYEQWVGRKNIFPYKPVFKYQSLKRGKLLSLPTLAELPVEEMALRVEAMKSAGVPVIGSVMGLSVAGYGESARMLENAGADAIEIDLCCTIPEFTTRYKAAGQNVNFNPALFAKIVQTVKQRVSIPVGVKSTASLFINARILEGLVRAKLANTPPDFLTLVGQLDENPGVDLETLSPLIPDIPSFGWQGTLSGLTYSALATFSSILGTRNPILSASGGIRDYQGVLTALALGATTVQLQTAILDKGPNVVARILKDLTRYLEERGINRIEEIIGTASRSYIPAMMLGRFMLERDTLHGRIHAAVQPANCSGCGLCAEVCTEGAVTMSGNLPEVVPGRCRACNLCVVKCPRDAMILEGSHQLRNLIQKYKDAPEAASFREFMAKKRIGWQDVLGLPGKLRQWGF